MYRRQFENTTFTQWVPETDKIKASHPQGKQPERSEVAQRRGPLRKRDAYTAMWVEIQFRGGPAASWLVKARGRTWRFPGHMALHDCLAEVAF
jgi:hypothetical protein